LTLEGLRLVWEITKRQGSRCESKDP